MATWKATVSWVLNTRSWRRTALSHCGNESLNIICLINRLKHFSWLLYLHSGCWSDNLILLSIYHNCLRLKASVEHYRAKGSNNGAGFTALPYVLVPPPPRLFHLSVQCLASVLETPGNIFSWTMFKISLSRVLPLCLFHHLTKVLSRSSSRSLLSLVASSPACRHSL